MGGAYLCAQKLNEVQTFQSSCRTKKFGEEKTLEWLSKFGKPLTPLEEETYNFGSDDEDDCQDCQLPSWNWKFICKNDN